MRPQVVLFPAVMLVILVLIILTGLLSKAEVVEAFTDPAEGSSAAQNPPEVANRAGPATPVQADQTSNRPVANCSLPAHYPESIRRWCELIETYAKKHSLDPRLVAAVMLQESGGDPDSYSSSGAVGLMQVMPRDGLAASFRCTGRPCFSARPSMAELYDPEFNISYGTRMLAGLIERHGNVRDALKYYGPMDVGFGYADIVLRIYNNYK